MKFFKLISITLFIATVLPGQLFADSNELGGLQIIAGPYLQKPMENSMAIMWVTNKNCTGYVNYGLSESMKNKAFSISSGLIEANKKIHRITIENLKPGTTYFYQVESTEIVKFEPYKVTFGEQVNSGIYKFKTLDNKKKQFSFLVLNDLHDNLDLTKALLAPENINNCDLIFLNGDIISDPQDEGQIIKFLSTLTELAAAQTPCIFVRGNHETRGRYARMFSDYIANPEERFYYSFAHGPVHFVVLDSGEDKEDSHWAYSGLNDFDGYRSIQAE